MGGWGIVQRSQVVLSVVALAKGLGCAVGLVAECAVGCRAWGAWFCCGAGDSRPWWSCWGIMRCCSVSPGSVLGRSPCLIRSPPGVGFGGVWPRVLFRASSLVPLFIPPVPYPLRSCSFPSPCPLCVIPRPVFLVSFLVPSCRVPRLVSPIPSIFSHASHVSSSVPYPCPVSPFFLPSSPVP